MHFLKSARNNAKVYVRRRPHTKVHALPNGEFDVLRNPLYLRKLVSNGTVLELSNKLSKIKVTVQIAGESVTATMEDGTQHGADVLSDYTVECIGNQILVDVNCPADSIQLKPKKVLKHQVRKANWDKICQLNGLIVKLMSKEENWPLLDRMLALWIDNGRCPEVRDAESFFKAKGPVEIVSYFEETLRRYDIIWESGESVSHDKLLIELMYQPTTRASSRRAVSPWTP